MMKKVLFLGCVILMQSLFGYSQDSKTRGFYSELDKLLEKHPYISYTVEQEDFTKDGEVIPRLYSISFDRSVKKNPVCYCFHDINYSRFDTKSLVYIDPACEEIHTYRSDWETEKVVAFDIEEVDLNPYKTFVYYQLGNYYGDDVFFSYFREFKPLEYVDRIINDTVIGGHHCKVYMGKKSRKKTSTEDGSWTPWYRPDIVFYYNKDKQWFDSVVVSLPSDVDEVVRKNVTFSKTVCRYKNVSFEDKTAEYDSIFSERNPAYAVYKHYDDSNPFGDNHLQETTTEMEKVLDKLTDDILEHPFVNVNGDTTTLGQQEGWVLIETWYDACRPCKQWMVDYEKEKSENGTTSLEQAGIKVLCVNPYVSYIDHLRKTADKYGIRRIVYAGKGLNEKFGFRYYPSYYLVSPDKHIVFTSETYVEDNSIFIEKMKEYEAR